MPVLGPQTQPESLTASLRYWGVGGGGGQAGVFLLSQENEDLGFQASANMTASLFTNVLSRPLS